MHIKISTLVGALTCALALPQLAQAATLFTTDGTDLYRFNSANPLVVTKIGALGVRIDGLDFRSTNGLLYGYSDGNDSVYTINTQTGTATAVSTLNNGTNTIDLGVDFNPVPDRMRIVTTSDQNLRANVDTGATLVDGTLKYATGDANEGVGPAIFDAAYTNADTDPATGTKLYYIDVNLDTLVTTADPNAGTLMTVGALGVDTSAFMGFDIRTLGMSNIAYALLSTIDGAGLYTIDLMSGAASLVGLVGGSDAYYGLAVGQPNSQVPEPGTLGLVALAGAAGLALRRRRA